VFRFGRPPNHREPREVPNLAEILSPYFGEPEPAPQAKRPSVAPIASDAELIDKARKAKNGSKFSALFDGDASCYGSQSEADLALCNALAFWCGPDPERIDRMFRSSGLFRAKWERADYARATIDEALAGRVDFYEERAAGRSRPRAKRREAEPSDDGFRLEPHDLGELLAREPEPLRYLHEPYLPVARRVWGFGATESAKSMYASWVAAKVTHEGGTVVYISEENPLDEDVRRLRRLRPVVERFRFVSGSGLDLSLEEHVDALIALCQGADLCVLDTASAVWSGDENDNAAVAALDREVLIPLVKGTGATVLVLDHTGHPQIRVNA